MAGSLEPPEHFPDGKLDPDPFDHGHRYLPDHCPEEVPCLIACRDEAGGSGSGHRRGGRDGLVCPIWGRYLKFGGGLVSQSEV